MIGISLRRCNHTKLKRFRSHCAYYMDPVLTMTLLLLTLFTQFRIIYLSVNHVALMNNNVMASQVIGILCCIITYVSVLLNYKLLRKQLISRELLNQGKLAEFKKWVKTAFGCRAALYIYNVNRMYQFRYLVILIGVTAAIAITSMTVDAFKDIKLEIQNTSVSSRTPQQLLLNDL